MDKKQSPIQESIQYWQERYNEANDGFSPMFAEAAGLFLQYLNVMARKEKEFIGEVWNAGEAFGLFIEDNTGGYPNKQQFLSQYYPKEESNGK